MNIKNIIKQSPLLLKIRFAIKQFLDGGIDDFLKKSKGVIHIGASTGNEWKNYRAFELPVIWVEPIPEVYKVLYDKIHKIPDHIAYQLLVTNVVEKEYEFNISNYGGASSSIFALKGHKDVWPDVTFEKTITLKSVTLESLVSAEHINIAQYDALILDTQGAELLVLKGAGALLNNFQFIKLEVADFEIYEGCCVLKEVNEFMTTRGYSELFREKFAERSNGGGCYNIVYKKQ